MFRSACLPSHTSSIKIIIIVVGRLQIQYYTNGAFDDDLQRLLTDADGATTDPWQRKNSEKLVWVGVASQAGFRFPYIAPRPLPPWLIDELRSSSNDSVNHKGNDDHH